MVSPSAPLTKRDRLRAHPEFAALSIAHVDCDAFYASVEKRDDPTLADRPVIVGGGKRGVVAAACYIARAYGVRSAMPMFKALKACPDAVVIRPDFSKYAKASRAIRELMGALTPLVEPISIDEAFLDLSGSERLHGGPPGETLMGLQDKVEREVGVTVSVGLSHNKFLAKIASDLDKPCGFAVIGREETVETLGRMKASDIWGVGPAFARRLKQDGFERVGDLQRAGDDRLAALYGDQGLRLARLSRGEDARRVNPVRGAKSVSAETTFPEDIRDLQMLEDRLHALCEKVARRMKEKDLAGRTVTLKLRRADFEIRTRRVTLEAPGNLARDLFEASARLLREATRSGRSGEAFRLIGVGFSGLERAAPPAQGSFFDDDRDRAAAREAAVDALRGKFGEEAVASGRSLRARAARRKEKAPDSSDP